MLLPTSLLRHRTVNLAILATENLTGANNESFYRRFQNFFLHASLCLISVESLILKKVLKLLKADEIYFIAMDREFGGEKWFKWSDDLSVDYILRVKSNTIVGVKWVHQYRSTRKKKAPYQPSKVWGMNVFFACKIISCKGKRDERLYSISKLFSGPNMLEFYKLRWGIESLFSHLKKRGFNIEDNHMGDTKKIETLFALISLAFLFSYAQYANRPAQQKAKVISA